MHATYFEVPVLSDACIDKIIDRLKTLDSRTLTVSQHQLFLRRVIASRMPLYAVTAWRLVCSKWISSGLKEDTGLVHETVMGLLDDVLDNVENELGRAFVSKTLAYITASRHGLSFSELCDVLSCDEDVMTEVFWRPDERPAVRRIPHLMIERLLEELQGCIEERQYYGCGAYFWYVFIKKIVELLRIVFTNMKI